MVSNCFSSVFQLIQGPAGFIRSGLAVPAQLLGHPHTHPSLASNNTHNPSVRSSIVPTIYMLPRTHAICCSRSARVQACARSSSPTPNHAHIPLLAQQRHPSRGGFSFFRKGTEPLWRQAQLCSFLHRPHAAAAASALAPPGSRTCYDYTSPFKIAIPTVSIYPHALKGAVAHLHWRTTPTRT